MAAHAGLTKAGSAVTSNPTSSDSAAWTGLKNASAAIDAGLAKATQVVSTHHQIETRALGMTGGP